VRGCLFVLVFAAAVMTGLAWFGAPIVASSVISAALQNAGFHAGSSTVSAAADPPPKLLLGRADRVEIVATDVTFRDFRAASLDLILTDVDVTARTAGRISGRIGSATLITSAGPPTTADIDIAGPANAADASIVVDGTTVSRVVKATLGVKYGVTASSAELVAPDILRISVGGSTVEGRLVVDAAGSITLSTPLGSSPILSLDPSFPLRLRSVEVDGGALRIGAILDATALLGG
jgi:hypothetical protein